MYLLLLDSAFRAPMPMADFRQILAVLVDVLLVLDQLILELLLEVDALVACLRQASLAPAELRQSANAVEKRIVWATRYCRERSGGEDR